jgi:PAS domain S-box-containing protein
VKSKHIGLRLGIAFSVLIAILAGVGQLGLRRMRVINDTLSGITEKQSAKLELTRRALMISNDNSRVMMEIVLVENRALVNTLLADRSDKSKEVSRLLEVIEGRCKSEKEKQLLLSVKGTRKIYLDSSSRAIHLLVDEGKHDEAEAVVVNEMLPALTQYHAAWGEFEGFQKSQVESTARQARFDYDTANRFAGLLIALAVIFALATAVFVTHETSSNVKRDLQRSDERMRLAVEAAKIGFWDWDVIKNKQVWSDTCKALLGVRPESNANFQVLMNSIHPDDRKLMEDEIHAAVAERRDYFLEYRVVWPDGSMHWLMARGRAFYDDAGRTIRMAGIAMDIDKRKFAEERMHLQAAALEAAANAIVITDSRGTMLWANRALTTMTGYSKEEVLGKNPRLLKSGYQTDSYYSELWSTISSGRVWKGEMINQRKDGSTYTEEMTITPVTRDGVAGDTHFIAIKQDISERRRAQDALIESEKRYRSLFENMLEGFSYCQMLFDERGQAIDFVYLAVNSAFGKLTGLENVVGKRFTEVIPKGKEPQPELLERYGRVARTGAPERFEIELDVLGMWFSISAYGAGSGFFIATFDNITERKQAEEALLFKTALLEAQTETTMDGILAVDESDNIILANKQFGLSFGIPDQLLRTRDDLTVRRHVMDQVENPDTFIERVQYLNSHRDDRSRDELRFKNGKIFDRYSAPLVDSNDRYRGRIWYFRDITDRKVAEDRVQFLAYYDALTELPNRALCRIDCHRHSPALAGETTKSRFFSSTSTGSKTSTTHWGTRLATCFCKRWQNGSRDLRVNRTPWPVWAATNSSSC